MKCLIEEMKEMSGIMSLTVLACIRPQISGGLSWTTGPVTQSASQSENIYCILTSGRAESVTFYYDFIKNIYTENTI